MNIKDFDEKCLPDSELCCSKTGKTLQSFPFDLLSEKQISSCCYDSSDASCGEIECTNTNLSQCDEFSPDVSSSDYSSESSLDENEPSNANSTPYESSHSCVSLPHEHVINYSNEDSISYHQAPSLPYYPVGNAPCYPFGISPYYPVGISSYYLSGCPPYYTAVYTPYYPPECSPYYQERVSVNYPRVSLPYKSMTSSQCLPHSSGKNWPSSLESFWQNCNRLFPQSFLESFHQSRSGLSRRSISEQNHGPCSVPYCRLCSKSSNYSFQPYCFEASVSGTLPHNRRAKLVVSSTPISTIQ